MIESLGLSSLASLILIVRSATCPAGGRWAVNAAVGAGDTFSVSTSQPVGLRLAATNARVGGNQVRRRIGLRATALIAAVVGLSGCDPTEDPLTTGPRQEQVGPSPVASTNTAGPVTPELGGGPTEAGDTAQQTNAAANGTQSGGGAVPPGGSANQVGTSADRLEIPAVKVPGAADSPQPNPTVPGPCTIPGAATCEDDDVVTGDGNGVPTEVQIPDSSELIVTGDAPPVGESQGSPQQQQQQQPRNLSETPIEESGEGTSGDESDSPN
jgi:hypothetical protein